MAEAATKLPVKNETRETAAWPPFDSLHQNMERMFDDFGRSLFRRGQFDVEPFWRRSMNWGAIPAVDIAEKDNAYEITAELPGMDEKDIEVKYAGGMLTIKGEKEEAKEEKQKDYHLTERRYGSFQRSFSVPDGVDADKLEADFSKGVLTVTLPKSPEAKKQEKKIPISAK